MQLSLQGNDATLLAKKIRIMINRSFTNSISFQWYIVKASSSAWRNRFSICELRNETPAHRVTRLKLWRKKEKNNCGKVEHSLKKLWGVWGVVPDTHPSQPQ